VPTIRRIKQLKREIISRHANSSDVIAWFQVVVVLAALVALWCATVLLDHVSHWLLLVTVPAISLFLLRTFALMHECGHACLFRSRWPNRAIGFVFGVISGMPQYVWSQHHNHHHATNGNWEKYRGAIATLSVREFAALSRSKQRVYQRTRHLLLAPMGGFIYLIFNPRFTWLKGTLQLWRHVAAGKISQPRAPLRALTASFRTRYWSSPREYWHMFWNNLVLLGIWAAMCWAVGALTFFTIYLLAGSLAGGAGLILFTVQHNFEHAYASDTEHWDYDIGAMRGTSFLVLPPWLNWFTANIGYHHVHHISASIPNYCLVRCHKEFEALFTEVPRLTLACIYHALECILWDEKAKRIISIAEYRQQVAPAI
jgi:omega-6 fatty acid desaturase (delta-12 desaturase)